MIGLRETGKSSSPQSNSLFLGFYSSGLASMLYAHVLPPPHIRSTSLINARYCLAVKSMGIYYVGWLRWQLPSYFPPKGTISVEIVSVWSSHNSAELARMYLTFGHCKLFCYAPCPHFLFFGIGLYLGTIDQPSLFFLISTTALVLQLLMFCDLQPAALRCPAPLVFLLASVPKVGRGGRGGFTNADSQSTSRCTAATPLLRVRNHLNNILRLLLGPLLGL